MSLSVQPAIDGATRLCAVFGSPIKHSASPAMHNAAFAALGWNWRYVACAVDPRNLRMAITGAQMMNFAGLNLTVPHKLLALDMVDQLDISAKIWGAVNTIRFEGRSAESDWLPIREFAAEPPVEIRSVGFNTDADGLVSALREDLQLEVRGKRVLLLGAGGAGRAAALKLAAENVDTLFLVNRTVSKVEELRAEIRQKFPKVNVALNYPGERCAKLDLVLNATSLGLKSGDGLPLDEQQFSLSRAMAVFDMIYRPAETSLLRAARDAGCRTANGLGMLLHQGARAFELWTGQAAPLAVMRRALEETIYQPA